MDLLLPILVWLFTTAALPLVMATANTCADCCGTPCPVCTNGTMPQTIQVDVSGVTNGTCSDCNDLNATYIVAVDSAGASKCTWGYLFPANICFSVPVTDPGFDACHLDVLVPGLAFTIVQVGTDLSWNNTTSPGRNDCDSWNLFSLSPSTNTTVCDNSSSTCLVTTL